MRIFQYTSQVLLTHEPADIDPFKCGDRDQDGRQEQDGDEQTQRLPLRICR